MFIKAPFSIPHDFLRELSRAKLWSHSLPNSECMNLATLTG